MLYIICYIISFIPLLILFSRIKVVNKKQLKQNSKLIFASNHMSNWDPFVISFKRGKKIKILAKKEIMNTKFKNWFFRSLGGIPIDRKEPELSSIKEVLRTLKNDEPICIFPTGTRKSTPNLTPQDIKDGVAFFAIRTQTPVVPMMFVRKNKFFGKNKLIVGDPIPSTDYTMDKESMEQFSNLVCEKMDELLEKHNGKQK